MLIVLGLRRIVIGGVRLVRLRRADLLESSVVSSRERLVLLTEIQLDGEVTPRMRGANFSIKLLWRRPVDGLAGSLSRGYKREYMAVPRRWLDKGGG